jgi:hypothetical protein
MSHHSALGIPAAAASGHGERHHGSHPDEPGSALHGECCSVMACGGAAVLQNKIGDNYFPPFGSKGFVPAISRLKSVALAGDPPVPRGKSA